MTFLKNKWGLATLVILCWASVASLTAGYYYYQYKDLIAKTRGTMIHVNLGINNGDGLTVWFNETEVKIGTTLLDVTTLVTNVNYTMYLDMGVLVNSIDDVVNSHPYYWMWWMWTTWGGWVEGPVACDRYLVGDGETLFWYYEDTSISPLPKPP